MLVKRNFRYSTERLLVSEWHSTATVDWNGEDLANIVSDLLTPNVTRSLPPAWQGTYSVERANNWIKERDEEGTTLIVIENISKAPIGLVILFESLDGKDIRLGYLLKESAWGNGFASELVQGLVEWCRNNGVASITGGVERDNIASIRVLEKTGFNAEADNNDSAEIMFTLRTHIPNNP